MKLNKLVGPITGVFTLVCATLTSHAVDFHVTSAQELQTALTLAAANGADDTIYLAAGYYTGNFNFNSSEAYNVTVQNEPGVASSDIAVKGAGQATGLNLAASGASSITVRGITFVTDYGNNDPTTLVIGGGGATKVVVDSCRFLGGGTNSRTSTGGGLVASGSDAVVTNCLVSGFKSGGNTLKLNNTGNILFVGCQIYGNQQGIQIPSARNVTAISNVFNGNGGYNYFNSSASGNSIFSRNLVVGNSGYGGGLTVANGTNYVTDNIFRGNGGGLTLGYINGTASGILSNNVFVANSTAVINAQGLVVNNSFVNNYSGGLNAYLNGTLTTISNNLFQGNSRRSDGGNLAVGAAVVCYGGNMSRLVSIVNNTFVGNSLSGGSVNYGSALSCTWCSPTVKGNTFVGNSGGCIYFENGGATLQQNVVRRNVGIAVKAVNYSWLNLSDNLVAKNDVGIDATITSAFTMINNTVTDNSGGGLSVSVPGSSETLDVYNNIIWGNGGSDITVSGIGSKKILLSNDVHSISGIWDVAANLIDVAPAFFDPVNGDYHLRSTSACIDAGTNGAPSIPALDLDGNIRTNGVAVDLGCYEFNNTQSHPADTNQNWTITAAEYANYANAWKNSQSWSAGPAQIPADYLTRAGYLLNKATNYHNDGAGAPLGWKPGSN